MSCNAVARVTSRDTPGWAPAWLAAPPAIGSSTEPIAPPAPTELAALHLPIDWREESRMEQALLRHRAHYATDPKVRALLLLTAETAPHDEADWLNRVGPAVVQLTADLARAGTLPTVPLPASMLPQRNVT